MLTKITLKNLALTLCFAVPFFTYINAQTNISLPKVSFNEQYIEGLQTPFAVDSIEAVFDLVFEALPDEVYVFPSENYYYFQFQANGQWIWGNIRLGVLTRDKGVLHFAYYTYYGNPQSPNDGQSFIEHFDESKGVEVKRLEGLQYAVSLKGKTVVFQLNELDQTPPDASILGKEDVFVQRTFDESGFPFLLIFNKQYKHFMYVLDEAAKLPIDLETVLLDTVRYENLWINPASSFIFYEDSLHQNRKILAGVWGQNIRCNNYWDGPFDQLADNFPSPLLKECIEAAYPYVKGGVDEYGFFPILEGSRMAISAYYEYERLEEFIENFEMCKRQPIGELLPCLTYDYKTDIEMEKEK
ncbi:MAG: hypothetical protein R3E32_28360 [Chitinophagales bacterium]